MGPEQSVINPLDGEFEREGAITTGTIDAMRHLSRRGAGYFRHPELLFAQIYISQNLQARGRRGGLRGKYRHRKLDGLADAVSVQAPRIFLAVYTDFKREFGFLIHPASCTESAG
jgi:hypothetical protein